MTHCTCQRTFCLLLKYDALKAVGNLYPDQKDAFLKDHKIEDAECDEWNEGTEDEETKAYQKGEKPAKELFQRAYAWTLSVDDKPIQAALRYEFLAIKVLRTLFAAAIILLLTTILGPWRRGSWWRLWKHKKEDTPFKPTSQDQHRVLLAAALLFALPLLFLALWSTQSKRYDKKVFHAYMVLAKDKDNDVMKPPPTATPTPTPTPTANVKQNPEKEAPDPVMPAQTVTQK